MARKDKNIYKKKFKWKVVLAFIVFEIVFTTVTIPFIIYHGPFKNVKKTLVGAAMSTLSHQYLATMFLSDAEIKSILSEDVIDNIQQGVNILKFTNKHDTNIEREDISEGGKFKGYMLIIHDPTRVKVGYSSKLGTEGEMTSQIASNNGAVAAVNGGGFVDKTGTTNWTGTGGIPTGLLMSGGKVISNDITDLNSKNDVMALTSDGSLLVGKHSLNELKKLGASEAISFGPALIVDGKITIKSGDGGQGIAPRTAIGQRRDGTILLLVIDGRQTKSVGASLKDVQNIMVKYEAYNATNLDGGSSSTMYYDGDIVNNPCDPLGERSVASVVYVK